MRTPAEIASAFAPREQLTGKKTFFLVGIGGAGMSGLARLLKERGLHVLGSDSTVSPEVERLSEEGFEVRIGHGPLDDSTDREATALILTDAIPLATSPEVASARR